ncbi:MAG: hypothetical protein U9N56_10270 [Actinomycetota bacterium]|nr:hypothetical protein [Actinomycetota bacterium]
MAMALVVSACSVSPFFTSANVIAVEFGEREEHHFLLILNECSREVVASVEETPARVVVTVRHRAKAGDCGSTAEIILEDPLGDRELIDAHDGHPILFPTWTPEDIPED